MYFYLFKSAANNQYYFNIKAANHVIIAQSEGYTTKANRQNAINIIKGEAGSAGIQVDPSDT